ncbi:MAG TPA: helix-turn-helix transcriptional regulator [Acidimicrobiales bacterium]|nr:helix-turn-helix transcriptional regulator [Acidimicrobiales bacterium]
MVTGSHAGGAPIEGAARFGLAPPRRFMLPAILLLLSEQPGYGYALVARLSDLQFGHVDRPAVYRALAALEQDGLVEAATESRHSASARRVYAVTALGERVLRVWMGVIREEQVHLGEVIRRYQATGRMDAVLSEVESGWIPDIELGSSSVSTTSIWRRGLVPLEGGANASADDVDSRLFATRPGTVAPAGQAAKAHSDTAISSLASPAEQASSRFVIDSERSAVLVDVRSTVGPISFGTIGVRGEFFAALADGVVNTDVAPTGWLTVEVKTLSCANKLYDAELQRRINSRRFPTARVELRECTQSTRRSRYRLRGELTFHGITRATEGTVCVESLSGDRIVISGEQVFDMRDFAVPSPTMLMLRFFPDVRVRLQAEAERAEA